MWNKTLIFRCDEYSQRPKETINLFCEDTLRLILNEEAQKRYSMRTMKKRIYTFEQTTPPGMMRLEEALRNRKSIRRFMKTQIPFDHLGYLLWAAYGFKDAKSNERTAPSAGACYPLNLYAVIGKDSIQSIKEGIYIYSCQKRCLTLHSEGDVRKELARAALGQNFIQDAPISIVFSADFSRTTSQYGERGIRYVYIDLGHAAQNLYLQATSIGMGTVAVGAFRDREIALILSLPESEEPLYIMPVGFPA